MGNNYTNAYPDPSATMPLVLPEGAADEVALLMK